MVSEVGFIDEHRENQVFYFNKPSLIIRIKSTLIDTVVIIVLMMILAQVLNAAQIQSGLIRAIALLLVMMYEPIMVSTGRTVGQRMTGLLVRNYVQLSNDSIESNIQITNSILRYIIKIILGWVSLVTIHSDKYGRAIHDKASNSIMTIESQ